MAGLYVHFPFCAAKCIYCDFYSRVRKDWTPYVEALLRELSDRRDEFVKMPGYAGHDVFVPTTLYFGGGTPSLLPAPLLARVAEAARETFGRPSCPAPTGHLFEEFTIEVNPDDVSTEKATAWRAMGATRISMGVQSFDDRHLRWMRRRHTAADAVAAFDRLRVAGFDNLSLDLIFGFTGLTDETWAASIASAVALRPEHISCYQMTGRYAEPDEEICRRQYRMLQERLHAAGYGQYEVSNYALPGKESRHNSAYWAREPYLGFGPGAHSFDGDRRRSWNTPDIDAYVASRQGGEEWLSDSEVLEEKLMLSLRTVRGLDLSILTDDELCRLNKTTLEELSRAGKIILEKAVIRIPEEELFVSDWIVSRLFPEYRA